MRRIVLLVFRLTLAASRRLGTVLRTGSGLLVEEGMTMTKVLAAQANRWSGPSRRAG